MINFRTARNIGIQTKTCPEGQVWELWLGQLDSLGRLCRHCAQPVTICGRGASQIYLVSNLLQRSLQMIQPSDPEPKIKTPIRVFEFLGWGNWVPRYTINKIKKILQSRFFKIFLIVYSRIGAAHFVFAPIQPPHR
jgi:hypothetical protein